MGVCKIGSHGNGICLCQVARLVGLSYPSELPTQATQAVRHGMVPSACRSWIRAGEEACDACWIDFLHNIRWLIMFISLPWKLQHEAILAVNPEHFDFGR